MNTKSKEKTAQLIFYVKRHEHRRLKLEALITGKTMSDIVRERLIVPLMKEPLPSDWFSKMTED